MTAYDPIPVAVEGPQLLLRAIPEGEPYPVEALGQLRHVVEAVQGQTLAPFAIPAASALAVASLAVQGFCDVETLAGSSPLSLDFLTIAKSGERKSSCDSILMDALRRHEREQSKLYLKEMGAWQNAEDLWARRRGVILKAVKQLKGDATSEANSSLNELGQRPIKPLSPDRTVTEPTYEGLTRKFAEGLPSLGLFSDEGGQFLGGFAMSKDNRQKTLAALNALWHGNPIQRTRGSEVPVTLFGRRLAMHLMVQPGVARDFMADPMTVDTGFLPRFLVCAPASTIGTRLQSHMKQDNGAIAEFSEKLTQILEKPLPMDAETGELRPRPLGLEQNARSKLVVYADQVEREQAPEGRFETVTGFASKSAEQAARIAGVLTVWEDFEAPAVSERMMESGIALASHYLTEALRLVDAAKVSEDIRLVETLRTWLQDRWQHAEILPSEVMQRAPIRELRVGSVAKQAIKTLETHGWLIRLPDGTVIRGKVRKEAYLIVRPGHAS